MHMVIFMLAYSMLFNLIWVIQITLNLNYSLFLEYFGMAAAMTISIFAARKLIDKRSIVSLGLNWDESSLRDIVSGVGIAALMMAGIFFVEVQLGWIRYTGTNQVILNTVSIFIWFLIFLLVAWAEELYNRGYLLQNLVDGINLPVAIMLSSTLFSLSHLNNPSASYMSVAGIMVAGLFFTFSYVWTQRLWLAMGLHFGWNFFEGPVFGFPVSGINTDALVEQTPVGPEIITGGEFGPEAGLILYPALVLGGLLMYLYTRYFADSPEEELDGSDGVNIYEEMI